MRSFALSTVTRHILR